MRSARCAALRAELCGSLSAVLCGYECAAFCGALRAALRAGLYVRCSALRCVQYIHTVRLFLPRSLYGLLPFFHICFQYYWALV